MNLDLLISNVTNPAFLFFILGIIAVKLKSDLEIPSNSSKFISLYLLLSIGFKGGQELTHETFTAEIAWSMLFGLALSLLIPLYTFFILKRKLSIYDAGAIAAAYGSVSAVTFVTAVSYLDYQKLTLHGHMVAIMALMESPAIIAGLILISIFNKEKTNKMKTLPVLKHSLTNGSVLMILGSLVIGLLANAKQAEGIKPFTNDIFKGKYYSVLDLRTEKFGKVENANYNPLPRPDVEVDETTKPFSISAYGVSGKQDVLVKDAGFGEAQPLLGDDVKRKFPIFWLDNTSFLYANFSKNQQSATIYKVNINHAIEKIGEITEIPATAANAFFEFASDGGVVYACGKGRFAIDLKKKMVTKLVNQPIGNNFFLEADENPKYGRSILYELEVIGKKWCRLENAKTVSGYAAFQSEIVMGEERYPQGVAIWNTTNKKWTSLDITNLSDIVGWVEE